MNEPPPQPHLDVAVVPYQQVLRLEVPVHQVTLMKVLQGKHNRRNVEASMRLRQRRPTRLQVGSEQVGTAQSVTHPLSTTWPGPSMPVNYFGAFPCCPSLFTLKSQVGCLAPLPLPFMLPCAWPSQHTDDVPLGLLCAYFKQGKACKRGGGSLHTCRCVRVWFLMHENGYTHTPASMQTATLPLT